MEYTGLHSHSRTTSVIGYRKKSQNNKCEMRICLYSGAFLIWSQSSAVESIPDSRICCLSDRLQRLGEIEIIIGLDKELCTHLKFNKLISQCDDGDNLVHDSSKISYAFLS